MMKTLILFLMFLSAPAFAENLIFADGALRAELTWLQGPQTGGYSALKLEWKNGSDQTRIEPPGPIKLTLWMPEHGHGSSPVTLTKLGQETGVYQASDIFFSMGGLWEVKLNLKYSNGREETQVFNVKLNGGGHHH